MQDKIYNLLLDKDEITWQAILYDLVRSGEMDPWDIDISLLTRKYLDTLKDLKESNFLISGKVVLAAAILLKIKSERLLNEKIALFDKQLFYSEEEEFSELNEFEEEAQRIQMLENPKLVMKTPLARKKRVSLNDLVGALQKALEVDQRRSLRKMREREHVERVKIPEKKIDITSLIKNLYENILNMFKKKEIISFGELMTSDRKEDKILTFIPLLHLVNQGKIDINQEEHFGEIYISKLN